MISSNVTWQYDFNDSEVSLAVQCAPLLCGLKIANLLIVKNTQMKHIINILNNKNISIHYLYLDQQKSYVILYDLVQLKEYLQDNSIGQFMQQQGFVSLEISALLTEITNRYYNYKSKKATFPHELGIILGYPLHDVIGFIKNQGNNSLYTGYWKVYDNLTEAKCTFTRYNKAKEYLLMNLMEGNKLSEIV